VRCSWYRYPHLQFGVPLLKIANDLFVSLFADCNPNFFLASPKPGDPHESISGKPYSCRQILCSIDYSDHSIVFSCDTQQSGIAALMHLYNGILDTPTDMPYVALRKFTKTLTPPPLHSRAVTLIKLTSGWRALWQKAVRQQRPVIVHRARKHDRHFSKGIGKSLKMQRVDLRQPSDSKKNNKKVTLWFVRHSCIWKPPQLVLIINFA